MFKGIASRALGVFALFTIVCGLGYTLVVTGVAQLAFPYQANGSLITVDGKVVGSELIGQNFDDEAHMWGRIQNVSIVEGEDGELMAYGAPSNLSPASEEYRQLIDARVKKIRAANPDADMDAVPVDLVTCSASTRRSLRMPPSTRSRALPKPRAKVRTRCTTSSPRAPRVVSSACSASPRSTCSR